MLKRIISTLCACVLLAVFSGSAMVQATAAETNLPDSFLIGDTDGIRVSTDGQYCIKAENVAPGDVIKKRLTIQNLDQSKADSLIPYTLSMLSETMEEKGPVNLLDVVQLELKLDGKVIYSGRCRGNADGNDITQRPLSLGEYLPGEQRTIDITLKVDATMPMTSEQSEALFAWHFYAVRAKDPEPPKTGDLLSTYAPYLVVVGGMMLFCFALMILKKKKDERAGYYAAYYAQ